MGYKRACGRMVPTCALLLFAAVCNAAPAKEPVILTSLGDPETDLVEVDESAAGSAADDRIRKFTQALTQAAAAEREAIAAHCKSLRSIPANGAPREAWEANCRYQRR